MKKTIQIYLLSSFWGSISPGRIGTLSRISYLYRYNISVIKGVANVLLDKLFDISCVLIYLYISIFVISVMFHTFIFKYIIAFTIIFALFGFGIFYNRNKISKKISQIQIKEINIFESVKTIISLKNRVAILIMSLCLWAIYFFCLYLISNALIINLSFVMVVFCVASSNLISMVPISIHGIGIRDAWLIFIFNWLGQEPEQAILFSSFFLIIYVELLLICSISLLFRTD